MKCAPMDMERWEEIAITHCTILSQQTFHGLFRFEVEYLRQNILDKLPHDFPTPDSEGNTNNEKQRSYPNKQQHCKHLIRTLLLSDFRRCGLMLFVNALRWHVSKSTDTDDGTGYVEEPLARGQDRGDD